MKKILLLTDFSDTSGTAVAFALQLHKGMTCSFTVLNCYIELPLSTDQVDEAVDHNAQTRLDTYIDAIRQTTTSERFSFQGLAIGGNLAMAVTSLYEKEPFDTVVVGASGTGHSVHLGSAATEIIRAARYPVLVVPGGVPVGDVEQVVIATNYRNFRTTEVFEPVRELVQNGIRRLQFLHVLDSDASESEVDTEGKELLDEYFKAYSPTHEYTKNDSTVEGIETYLSEHATDLLVTVSHHQSLWDVLLNRSTSRILAYEARVPLLVLFENVSDSSDELFSPEWNVIL